MRATARDLLSAQATSQVARSAARVGVGTASHTSSIRPRAPGGESRATLVEDTARTDLRRPTPPHGLCVRLGGSRGAASVGHVDQRAVASGVKGGMRPDARPGRRAVVCVRAGFAPAFGRGARVRRCPISSRVAAASVEAQQRSGDGRPGAPRASEVVRFRASRRARRLVSNRRRSSSQDRRPAFAEGWSRHCLHASRGPVGRLDWSSSPAYDRDAPNPDYT
jgi:hypothetical protein